MSNLLRRIMKIRNIEYILLAFTLLLAFGIRLYKIDNPIADWHSWRQADTASVTRNYVKNGINLLYPTYHDISSTQTGIYNSKGYRFVEFPLYNVIHAQLVNSFPQLTLEMWGRLLSVASAVGSSYLLFLIGKRYWGVWIGVFSAFFYALLPYNIYFTRVVLPEPLAVFLALLSMWFFIRFIDTERYSRLFVSAFILALSMMVKPFTFFYSVPLAYLAIKKYGVRGLITNIKFLIALNIALIPFFSWRIWVNQFPAGIPHFNWAFNGDGIRFRPAFWRWIFSERLGAMILGVWGIVPFVFGLLKSKGKNYFLQFFLLGMFLYVSVFATANVRHDYYQTFIVPAVSLTLAVGAVAMWRGRWFNRLLTRSLLIFSVALMFVTSAVQIRGFYQINHPEIIEAGAALQKFAAEDALVIAPYNGDTAFLYHTERWGWPVLDLPVEELVEKGADYFVSVNFDDDTNDAMSKYEVIEKTNTYVIIDLNQPL